MPELPEVETIMTLVKCRVENKKIKKTKVINRKLRWPIETRKVRHLEAVSYTHLTLPTKA